MVWLVWVATKEYQTSFAVAEQVNAGVSVGVAPVKTPLFNKVQFKSSLRTATVALEHKSLSGVVVKFTPSDQKLLFIAEHIALT